MPRKKAVEQPRKKGTDDMLADQAIRLLPPVEDGDYTVRQSVLEQRLEDGYQRIERAIRSGEDVQRWEDFWVGLLHEYELLCDRLDRAA